MKSLDLWEEADIKACPARAELSDALTSRIGSRLKKRFSEVTVAVCGLGGLGSNIAVSLVRAGIGRLLLVDFDKVDITNLNRQQYKASQIGEFKTEALLSNLLEISPYAEIEVFCVRLDESNYSEILENAGIICEAFDDAEEKSRLVNYVLENMPEKTIVAASGMAGLGSPNDIKTRRISGNFFLCGDGVSGTDSGDCLYSARVALCAAHQALTVLQVIAGENDI